MGDKILLFGTSYVDTAARYELFNMWVQCVVREVGFDFLLVDSPSGMSHLCSAQMKLHGGYYFCFDDNIGHLAKDGKDGWGRAFVQGIQMANDYDYVVHIESDLLYKFKILDVISKMKNDGIKVLSTKCKPYGWCETGIVFMDANFMRSIDFVKKYDYPSKKNSDLPEKIFEDIVGESNIYYESWDGLRDDKNLIVPSTAANLDYLTHSTMKNYIAFMGRDYYAI